MNMFINLLNKVNCIGGYKEQRNLFLYSINNLTKNLALEIGKRFVKKDILLCPTDIFYLKQNEISEITFDCENGNNFHDIIKNRKSSYSKNRINMMKNSKNFQLNIQKGIKSLRKFSGIIISL